MTPQEKLSILKTVGEEIVTEEELLKLLEEKEHPVAYDGFEPSGLAPIHFGLLRARNVKKLQQAGVKMVLYLGDYFAYINNKLGGDLQRIRRAGEYFVHMWQACGIDTSKVQIVWARDLMDRVEYWERVLTVAKNLTINRTVKSLTIAGRSQKDKLTTAQYFYPSMQVADIFELGVDICQLGMDQRRANMLGREVAGKMGWQKPIPIHHHILLGLKGIQKGKDNEETLIRSKMSKSDPTGCIYMHDTKEELEQKINSAFCPPKQVEGNPVLEYCRYILFEENESLTVTRLPKYGSNRTYKTYKNLEGDYVGGNLHPTDLKKMVSAELEKLIRPVREYFETNEEAKKLYEEVKSYQITR